MVYVRPVTLFFGIKTDIAPSFPHFCQGLDDDVS